MHSELIEKRRWISEQRFRYAVMGVIVSLALFFAQQMLHHDLPEPHWDYTAAAITTAACIVMFRLEVGTIKLILACAISGLVVSYSGRIFVAQRPAPPYLSAVIN